MRTKMPKITPSSFAAFLATTLTLLILGNGNKASVVNGQIYGLSCGWNFCCGLDEQQQGGGGGSVVGCWGDNNKGQLAAPSSSDVCDFFDRVAARTEHACGYNLDKNDTVSCWGNDEVGQASPPGDLGPIKFLAGGRSHTCAIRSEDDQLVCWGGDGLASKPPDDLGPVETFAACLQTCAVRADDGAVRCFGDDNSVGQLDPPSVDDIGRVVHVTVGADYGCAIRQDDETVVCWGNNTGPGELHDPPAAANEDGFETISAAAYHTCGVLRSGAVLCWGDNAAGQSDVPADLGNAYEVAAGESHKCAIKSDATAECWGSNEFGQTSPIPTWALQADVFNDPDDGEESATSSAPRSKLLLFAGFTLALPLFVSCYCM